MAHYRFEIDIKDDDLLETVNTCALVLEAESDEEALEKFGWIASERGWDTHTTEELVDGNWTLMQ
ncbi:MAG: hypothetical protein AB4040_13805 [Synechococcus sp.]